MHPLSFPLTIGRTVLNESDDLDIMGVTFERRLLCSVSRAASQRLGILIKFLCFWNLV